MAFPLDFINFNLGKLCVSLEMVHSGSFNNFPDIFFADISS